MNILVAIVNYNHAGVTLDCIESLRRAQERCGPDLELEIVVTDNASRSDEIDNLQNSARDVFIVRSEVNLGYLGGLNKALEGRDLKNRDFVILANNDLLFESNFFDLLQQVRIGIEYGAICPDIVTIDGVHQNPHEIRQVSKMRKFFYSLYFTNYRLGRLMYKMQQVLKAIRGTRNRVRDWDKGCDLYLGYGAIYIIRGKVFESSPRIDYPSFLMGEEYYVSKKIADAGLKIRYVPELCVHHLEHASVSKLPTRKMYEYEKVSFMHYRKIWNKIALP